MEQSEMSFLERKIRWQGMAKGRPPEWIASYEASPGAVWTVIIQDGEARHPRRFTARLKEPEDLPCWAYVLAKSYLDDVGEWPLYGMKADVAMHTYEEDHQDIERAVHEMIAAIHPVWPDVKVIFLGQERTDH
ncbi:MAG: hypothetical protein HQL53_01485 [Magnetococcales bacterium]|nr:hypothetical protein [Magnetococcales bacterium]